MELLEEGKGTLKDETWLPKAMEGVSTPRGIEEVAVVPLDVIEGAELAAPWEEVDDPSPFFSEMALVMSSFMMAC